MQIWTDGAGGGGGSWNVPLAARLSRALRMGGERGGRLGERLRYWGGGLRGIIQLKRNPTLLIPLLFPVLPRGW